MAERTELNFDIEKVVKVFNNDETLFKSRGNLSRALETPPGVNQQLWDNSSLGIINPSDYYRQVLLGWEGRNGAAATYATLADKLVQETIDFKGLAGIFQLQAERRNG